MLNRRGSSATRLESARLSSADATITTLSEQMIWARIEEGRKLESEKRSFLSDLGMEVLTVVLNILNLSRFITLN